MPPEIHWIRDVDLGRRVLIQPDVTHVSDDANHLDRKRLPKVRLALRRLEERDLMADGIRLGPVPPGEGLVDEGHVRRRRHVPLIEGASPPDRDLHSAEVLGGHGSEEYGFVLTGPRHPSGDHDAAREIRAREGDVVGQRDSLHARENGDRIHQTPV